MPRFAILTHDHPTPHWDLLLENGDTCRTWRLMADPAWPSNSIQAVEIADHRLLYLDYEGPVSENRGIVMQWDTGTFDWIVSNVSDVEVRLSGRRWNGHVRLTRVTADFWNCVRVDQTFSAS